MLPFVLLPQFVQRIWGTQDLRPWYQHTSVADEVPIGEVWLTGDTCRAATGDCAGDTLAEIFAAHSVAMLGAAGAESAQGASPLLLKVIFANEKLSVQVHPDDHLAQKYGQPRGKTECWYALSADPCAEVAVGLRPGVTLGDVRNCVADGKLERNLNILPIVTGDMVFVDAGTVHAIWPGSILLETQQNCDITYRLYDYGRPRELHVERALEAIRLQTAAGKVVPVEYSDRTVLVESDYFCVEKIPLSGFRAGASMVGSGLVYLFAASGSGRITAGPGANFNPFEFGRGALVVVPASSPAWQVEDAGGLELIRITPRWPNPGAAASATA